MAYTRKTYLFGDFKIAMATHGRSEIQHSFGGPCDLKGTSRADCQGFHIHLLHRLDLSDPAIPIAIPGIRWLSFYNCFDFRANNDFGYRLESDDSLQTFFADKPAKKSNDDWPDKDYPLEFPKSSIKIEAYPYDPKAIDDVWNWAGVFGWGKLSKANQAALKEQAAEEFDLDEPPTDEELEEFVYAPFLQGRPYGNCANPRCRNHKSIDQLSTIALMPAEPVKGVHIFGRSGGGVDLIFQICPTCYSIRVSNQCT